MTANTHTTALLAKGLAELPDISESGIESMLRRVKSIESEMDKLRAKMDDAIADLAREITADGDGWTYMEIWETGLRGHPTLMTKVREITGEA